MPEQNESGYKNPERVEDKNLAREMAEAENPYRTSAKALSELGYDNLAAEKIQEGKESAEEMQKPLTETALKRYLEVIDQAQKDTLEESVKNEALNEIIEKIVMNGASDKQIESFLEGSSGAITLGTDAAESGNQFDKKAMFDLEKVLNKDAKPFFSAKQAFNLGPEESKPVFNYYRTNRSAQNGNIGVLVDIETQKFGTIKNIRFLPEKLVTAIEQRKSQEQ